MEYKTMESQIYFISGIDTDAGKVIVLPGMPVNLPKTANASSRRNSYRPEM